ncbi:MAG TPA: biotin--[acetyl-CoA-carboxylase] ligase [Bacilli bacterium]|nr:biotin--[acetyl-CoA-carboxylase] ligase [Bacilli bacterium]
MNFDIKKFEILDSTSDYAKQNFRTLNDFSLIRADYQTRGRGQFTRRWESDDGKNLLFSLLIKSGLDSNIIKSYERATLDAIVMMLSNYGISSRIKLPNDIYVDDKKIAGMLLETRQISGAYEYLIIGIGLNVKQTSFSQGLLATSMMMLANIEFDLEKVFLDLVEEIEHRFLACSN